MTSMTRLSAEDIETLSALERSCSAISILGSLFIIVTFSGSSAFREKPINRLVFYASFGNLMANVGILISRTYIHHVNSFGCQFQAMIIQWFLAADAGWILAMAVNVYLTLYRKFDTKHLRRIELIYLLCCYGIPFIPAFAFIFIRRHGKRIYGDAVLWCWVDNDFEVLRFATLYGPVWVMISLTLFIYIRTGRTIFITREAVRKFNSHPSGRPVDSSPVAVNRRNEVRVTEDPVDNRVCLGPIARGHGSNGACSACVIATSDELPGANVTLPQYYIDICESTGSVTRLQSLSQTYAQHSVSWRRSFEFKSAAWAYAKWAMLYFAALLITWVPSTAHSTYTFTHHLGVSFPLAIMSSLVLPLQGFWNWLIYVIMSWSTCKGFFRARRVGS